MRLCTYLAVLAAAPAAALARGDGSFKAPLKLVLPHPVAAAAGDFDGDGKLDLAAVNYSSLVALLLQSPHSRLHWTTGGLTAGRGCYSLRAADFDQDGDLDLLIADPATTLYFVRGGGDGSFLDPEPLSQARGAHEAAIGDWDQDGKLDLAAVNHDLLTTTILRGGGDGTFALLQSYATSEQPHDLEALDYDGDGAMDLAVGLESSVLPLRRGAGGTFYPGPLILNLGNGQAMTTADFNNDRRRDLITHPGPYLVGISVGDGSYRRSWTAVDPDSYPLPSAAGADLDGDGNAELVLALRGAILVEPGRGDGTFLDPRAFGPAGTVSYYCLAADLDLDGEVDVVSTDGVSSALDVFWGSGGGRFLEAGEVFLSGFPPARAMAVGDLDRDGRPDLFLADSGSSGVWVFLDPSAGSAAAPSLRIETEGKFATLEAVDLDGDRVPDLAGASLAAGEVVVALLEPAGGVRSEAALPVGLLPSALAAGRIDEGTAVDLAVACAGSHHLAILLGQGGGAFEEARTVPTLERPRRLALGDLDRDGRTDLAVISTTALVLHHGEGGGRFGGMVVVFSEPERSLSDLALGDLDQDGLLDIVVSETRTSSLLLFRGERERAFGLPRLIPMKSAPDGLALADLDGDGRLDLTSSHPASQSISVLLNEGGGTFGAPVSHGLGFNPLGHLLADLNGDGALDLAAFSASSAVVLFGRSAGDAAPRFRRGDADGDGAVRVNDPVVVLGHLFLGQGSLGCEDAADSNDDSQLNLSDPVATLTRLFLGGAPLPAPGSESCGEDPTDDLLSCRTACR